MRSKVLKSITAPFQPITAPAPRHFLADRSTTHIPLAMKRTLLPLATALAISAQAPSAHAMTILITGTTAANPNAPDEIEAFLMANLVLPAGTTFLKGNYANFANHQATIESADIVIIGRTLSSADYQNGVADGYNTLAIPVIALTSYVARPDGNRLGWHTTGATTNAPVAAFETAVTAAGSTIFGIASGLADFFEGNPGGDFNGLSNIGFSVGGGTVLATIEGRLQSAYWAAGSAPGDPVAASPVGDPNFVFPGERFLFNLDNDVEGGGAFTFQNLTPDGTAALVAGLSHVTGLAVIPEPSSALMAVVGIAACGLCRRRRPY